MLKQSPVRRPSGRWPSRRVTCSCSIRRWSGCGPWWVKATLVRYFTCMGYASTSGRCAPMRTRCGALGRTTCRWHSTCSTTTRQGRGSPARLRLLRREPGDPRGRYLHPQDPERRAARGGAGPLCARRARRRDATGGCRGRRARGARARGRVAVPRRRRHSGDLMTTATAKSTADVLIAKAQDRSALIGIVGLGYVGLPLAMEFARVGFRVLGFDVSKGVVDALVAGRSHVQDVASAEVAGFAKTGKFAATTDLSRLREPDVVSICVPTP